MTYEVVLAGDADFGEWRGYARVALALDMPPEDVRFSVCEGDSLDLFRGRPLPAAPPIERPLTIPARFKSEAVDAARHADPVRFQLLYRLAWRFRDEPRLMAVETDPDVVRLHQRAQAVRRDLHKMKAFVRFRQAPDEREERFVAWFEPAHHITPSAAEFFRRRFTGMIWTLFTPGRSAHWDRHTLVFGNGVGPDAWAAIKDGNENLWKIYFANIFNPARLKTKAMQAQMPKKYWKNLPEAALIPDLVKSAGARTEQMVTASPSPPPARHARLAERRGARPGDIGGNGVATPTLERVCAEAAACRRCPLWSNATQTVFGEGPATAQLMFVAEQPGDSEDLSGRPLVGPAGTLFDAILKQASVDRSACYVTNAVKHFKNQPRGKIRLHKTPGTEEIEPCRWWLEQEIAIVKPRLIVALGATALRSLTGYRGALSHVRGRVVKGYDGRPVLVTVHPAYLLRLRDPQTASRERGRTVADLIDARKRAFAAKSEARNASVPPTPSP